MSTTRRVVRAGAVSLAVLVVALGAVLWAQGWRLYAVASGSMLPTYAVGDLVVTAPPRGEVVPGDVVTYPSPEGSRHEVTTHRVVDVTAEGLVTQGDANDTSDVFPVPVDAVVGRVTAAVPAAGYAVVFVQQPAGVGAVMTSLLSLVLLWGLFFPDDGRTTTTHRAPRPDRPAGVAASVGHA